MNKDEAIEWCKNRHKICGHFTWYVFDLGDNNYFVAPESYYSRHQYLSKNMKIIFFIIFI